MGNEIQTSYSANQSIYSLIRNSVAQIWTTSGVGSFVAYNTASYPAYVIDLTEQGVDSGYYAGNFPTAIGPGVYSIVAKNQVAINPAETDPTVSTGDFQWNGTVSLPLSNLATSGQVGQFLPVQVYRGQMVKPFVFSLVSAADHITPFTSGVVSGQISRDGGAFTNLQSGSFSEIGLGFYALGALTSGDLNAKTAAISFNAVGISGGESDPRNFVFILQNSSG